MMRQGGGDRPLRRGAAALAAVMLLMLMLALGCAAREPAAPEAPADGRTRENADAQSDAAKAGDESAGEDKPSKPAVQADIPSLAEAYAGLFPIGAAIEPEHTEGLMAELLKKHVNMLVAENVMKPSNLQPTEGQFRFEQADKIVAFAKENGMALRFHTLVWHQQTPDWFFRDLEGKRMADETDPAKREENKKLLLERLEKHIRAVVEHFKDDIQSWDVVNEVIEPADPDGLRNSEWYQIAGIDYIETAFRAAREAAGPDAKLYINDYNTNELAKRERLYELVKELLDRGVPIDGIGHQTHVNVDWPSAGSLIESMRKFAELGLDNIVTEMDMSIYAYNDHSDYGRDIPETVLQKQADRYREFFEAFRDHRDLVSAVVFWGIADSHTWLHDFPVRGRTDAPLLFDRQLQAKPAFWAAVEAANP